MMRVTALYPAGPESTFNHAYYRDSHVPMVRKKLGRALKRSGIENGIGTMEPGKPAPFMAAGFLEFDSVDAFGAAFGPHADAILADIANFTNVQPMIQIAEIVE